MSSSPAASEWRASKAKASPVARRNFPRRSSREDLLLSRGESTVSVMIVRAPMVLGRPKLQSAADDKARQLASALRGKLLSAQQADRGGTGASKASAALTMASDKGIFSRRARRHPLTPKRSPSRMTNGQRHHPDVSTRPADRLRGSPTLNCGGVYLSREISTVRTRLKMIYAKTKTHRQSQLAALTLGPRTDFAARASGR